MTRPTPRRIFFILLILTAMVLTGIFFHQLDRRRLDLRLQQAYIALENEKPDEALAIVNGILEKQAGQIQALTIKARAQMQLKLMEESRTTLETLTALKPNFTDIRRTLVKWSFSRMDQLMGLPDFPSSRKLQSDFDRALKTGLVQAKWLADHERSAGDSHFLQARFILADVYRLRILAAGRTRIYGALERARGELQTSLAKNPGYSPALYLLARTFFEEENFGEAQKILENLVVREPDSLQIKVLYTKTLLKTGRLPLAEIELSRIDKKGLNDPEILSLFLQAGQMKGSRSGVAELLGRIEKFSSLTDQHLILLADGYLYLEREEKRVGRILDYLHERYGNDISVNVLRGKYYLQRNRFDLAADILDRVLTDDPGNAPARLLFARALCGLHLYQEALTQLEKLTFGEKMDPVLLARMKLQQGDLAGAEDLCVRALNSGRNDSDLRLILAWINQKKNNPGLTEYHLQVFIRSRPENPTGYALLSRFYLERKKIKEGLVVLQDLQMINDSLARLAQSWLLAQSGKCTDALACLTPVYGRLVEKRDPNSLLIAEGISAILVRQKKLPQALAAYRPLIQAGFLAREARLRQIDISPSLEKLDDLAREITPAQPQLMYQLLLRYERLGRFDHAMPLLDRWIQCRPDQAVLLKWKGEFLYKMGQPAKAAEIFRRALDREPDNLEFRQGLARAWMADFDFCRAEGVFREMAKMDAGARRQAEVGLAALYAAVGLNRRAVQICPRLQVVRPGENSGQETIEIPAEYLEYQSLLQKGETGRAMVLLEKLHAEPGPLQPAAGNDLAYLLARNHPEKLDEAHTLAMALLKEGNASPQLLDTLGWIEHLRGNDGQALKYLNRAVVRLNSHPEVKDHLRIVYQSLGNATWAGYYQEELSSRAGSVK